MHSINILDYAFKCSQGDTKETIIAIKTENVTLSSKRVSTLNDTNTIPYHLLQENIPEKSDAIKNAIKKLVAEIVSSFSSDKKSKTALLVGTSLVDQHCVDAIEDSVYEYKRKPYSSAKKSIDSFAEEIVQELQLCHFSMTISTACTSSVNALLEARNLINSGVCDYAIVVGIEIYSQMMSDGFSSMKLLSGDLQRPFDTARDGLVLGEALAAVLIGKENSPWSLRGGYSNCNSLNITSVSPSGEEYAQVMQEAMSLSHVDTHDITALKAHATATLANDMSEIYAIKKVFDPTLVFTAIKPYVGHTLGACGILELAIFMACIDDGFLPKTLNHNKSIIKDYIPLQKHQNCSLGIFMLNYFGFGGNNTSIIIQKELI